MGLYRFSWNFLSSLIIGGKKKIQAVPLELNSTIPVLGLMGKGD